MSNGLQALLPLFHGVDRMLDSLVADVWLRGGR